MIFYLFKSLHAPVRLLDASIVVLWGYLNKCVRVCVLSKVMQDFQQQQFVQHNPVFHSAPAILFQPSDTDKVGSSAMLTLLFSWYVVASATLHTSYAIASRS